MFYHCDTLVHSRLNIFFVAQAFLFMAFMNNNEAYLSSLWIAVLGLVFTLSYWLAIARMERTVSFLKQEFQKTCRLFECQTNPLVNRLRPIELRLSSYYLLVWVCPCLAALTWAVLLVSALR